MYAVSVRVYHFICSFTHQQTPQLHGVLACSKVPRQFLIAHHNILYIGCSKRIVELRLLAERKIIRL
jgi:hypothetical protein